MRRPKGVRNVETIYLRVIKKRSLIYRNQWLWSIFTYSVLWGDRNNHGCTI